MSGKADEFSERLKAGIANASPTPTVQPPPTTEELIHNAKTHFHLLFESITKFDEVLKEKFGNTAVVQVHIDTQPDTKNRILRGHIIFAKEGYDQRQIPISIQGKTIWFEDSAFYFSYQRATRRDYDPSTVDQALDKLTDILTAFFS